MQSRTICREVKSKANKRIWPWNNRTSIWCRMCRVVHRLISACDTRLSSRLNFDYSGYVTMQKYDGTCSECLCCIGVYWKTYEDFRYVWPTGPTQFFSDYTEAHQLRGSAYTRTFINLQLLKCHPSEPHSLISIRETQLCSLWPLKQLS